MKHHQIQQILHFRIPEVQGPKYNPSNVFETNVPNNIKNRVLSLIKQTLYQLQLKDPKGKEPSQEILLPDKSELIHAITFEDIAVEAGVKTKVVQDFQG